MHNHAAGEVVELGACRRLDPALHAEAAAPHETLEFGDIADGVDVGVGSREPIVYDHALAD